MFLQIVLAVCNWWERSANDHTAIAYYGVSTSGYPYNTGNTYDSNGVIGGFNEDVFPARPSKRKLKAVPIC